MLSGYSGVNMYVVAVRLLRNVLRYGYVCLSWSQYPIGVCSQHCIARVLKGYEVRRLYGWTYRASSVCSDVVTICIARCLVTFGRGTKKLLLQPSTLVRNCCRARFLSDDRTATSCCLPKRHTQSRIFAYVSE